MDAGHSSSNVTNIYVNGGYEDDNGDRLQTEPHSNSRQDDALQQNERIQDSSTLDQWKKPRFLEQSTSREQGSQVNGAPVIIPVNLPEREHSGFINEVPPPDDNRILGDDPILMPVDPLQMQDENKDVPVYPERNGSFDGPMTTVYVKNFAQQAFNGRSVVHVQNLPRKEGDNHHSDNAATEQVGFLSNKKFVFVSLDTWNFVTILACTLSKC